MKLVLNKRDSKGKNKVDKLRANGEIPGVLYSKGEDAKLLSGLEKDLLKAFSEEGYSNIFEIEVDGETISVLFKEVQMHHIKNSMVHFDLYEVDMNSELTVEVPVILEGRDDIRVQPSSLIQVLNEVEVTCLPKYLPSEAVVNVIDMQIGDVVTVADLDIYGNENIKIDLASEETVATLVEPTEEKEPEETGEEASAEVPTVSESEEKEETEE
ncbi:50S ribosomal protein L25 [Peptoniphilus lacydonensis]|jgi:ribosomal protein L25, ctc-form|uniref:50S ribosomal protein L25 n=1 Tax=Peptoniphilus lacydonensis TaxID=1673725 RepID=UPI0008DA49AB|nr:50S ribosomal protein L25 [Peptoniphilus lacydonensis]MBS6610709.1 50S ribosomal protein L25 [Peptoniphilus harei]MDU1954353.1 50S ribosomal protein L25 [Peptoniphilus lacydonensis]MDU5274816.1 50S ribosomal protein L25 [Peptoniphilus lacydonensis]MDU5376940.1 50S ribosomal protein L25 [Peptoniphilus lacydonensis]MDU5436351.1 50S ribosomal protein L25 [Peptoniphilus lacydonensis]